VSEGSAVEDDEPSTDGSREACENGLLHNHYPFGEGLATSPSRHARLRFHTPFSA
jgi:hypothetical protein